MSSEIKFRDKTNASPSTKFSNVLISESPGFKTTQKNITGYPRIVRDLCADIYNNIQKWNDLHITGACFMKQVASIKADTYKSLKYPPQLEELTNDIFNIVNLLEDIIQNLRRISDQMKTLTNLYKSDEPLFITWPVYKFYDTSENITSAYKLEFELKKAVCAYIAHSKSKEELMFYATVWAVQPYIDDEVAVFLESLLTETGHRSIK